jgi:membrane protease YdiL (CAAX protease family)
MITKRLFAYSPNLAQSWKLVILIFLCANLITFPVVSAFSWLTDAALQEWHSIFGSLLEITIVALLVVRLGKNSDYVPVTPLRQSNLLWFLLIPFIFSVSLAVEPLTMWIPMPDIFVKIFTEAFQNNLPSFLTIVVIAPLYEEWLYRGIILKGLLANYSPQKAILWSAVIFSVIHANPWQGVSAFFGGLAIGWIYWRTRSLRYCVFMHGVVNALGFLSLVFFPDTRFDATTSDLAGGYYIYVYALILIVGVLSWMRIKKIISSDATTGA